MIIIGEKINGSIPAVAKAIAERDADFIKARAISQEEAGATFIDCCASVPEEVEVETLKWMIDCIQEVSDLPIAVDSPSANVLAEAYKFCKKPGLINSVSGEGDKIDKIFPILAENKGWQVIALLSDDTGIPKNAADRLRVLTRSWPRPRNMASLPAASISIPWWKCSVLPKTASQPTSRSLPRCASSILLSISPRQFPTSLSTFLSER